MDKKYPLSAFIFRRDLRKTDNIGLLQALIMSERVIPIFIFDPRLLTKETINTNALQFMCESLGDLQKSLVLKQAEIYFFEDLPHVVINRLVKALPIQAIFTNVDYTPFSKKRDRQIKNVCKSNNVEFLQNSDYVLSNLHGIFTSSGSRYKVFTPFYNKASQKTIPRPRSSEQENYFKENIEFADNRLLEKWMPSPSPNIVVSGGRTHGLKILSKISEHDQYQELRDYPSLPKTTNLSAHHRFGTISVRETYHIIKEHFSKNHPLIRQLYWRDFYYYLAIHFPHVFDTAFQRKYRHIEWKNDMDQFEKWSIGKTGFPIVDAGIRQLNTTGFMHNRIRMITASFLVKDLHIDWRWGEKYFAEKLVDYDPAINNGNWQWAASTGADAQPYFRIFNPWRQQKKYDRECVYIKKYIPELRELSPQEIHRLETKRPPNLNYPPPLVDHKESASKAKLLFKLAD